MPLKVGELYATLKLDNRDFDRGLDTSRGRFEGLRGVLTSGVRAAATAFATATTAVAGLGIAAFKVGVDYNRLQQSSRAALTTILRSAEAAADQMDRLDEFAQHSPFAKQVFIQAQQQMLGFGIEASKVIPYLDAIQNAVAATGGSSQDVGELAFVLSQISAAGKITATDLMQLGQRGVDAATLIGEQMGFTGAEIRDQITAGTLDADAALDALAAGMTDKFGGATALIKEQMDGALDRVKGAWRDIGSALAAPFVDPNGGGLAVDWTNQFADALRALEDQIGPVVNLLSLRLEPAFAAVSAGLDAAKVAIDGFNLGEFNRQLESVGKYTPLIAGASTALFALGTSNLPILSQLGFAGINPVVAGLAALAVTSPEARRAFGDVVAAAQPLLPILGELGLQLADTLLYAIENLVPPLGELAVALVDSGVSVATALTPALVAVLDAAIPLIDVVGDLVGWVAGLPTPVLAAAAAFVALNGPAKTLGPIFKNLREQAAVQAALGGTSQATGALSVAMMGARAPIQAVGMALKTAFVANPVGLAITGLVTVLGIFGGAQRDAKADVEELRGALDAQTGAWGENTAAVVANKLEQDGILEMYEAMGGKAADLIGHLEGNADATERYNAVLAEQMTLQDDGISQWQQLSSEGQRVQDAVDGMAWSLDEAAESNRRMNDVTREGADESRDYTNALQAEIDKLRERSDALDDAANSALNTAAAQSRFAATVDQTNTLAEELADTIAEGTHTLNGNREAFDLSTEAGRRSHDQLVNTARSANDLTNAMIENGHSQADVRAAAESARESFIRQAVQLGLTEAAAGALADEYGLIPSDVVTKVELRDAEARGRLRYWTNLNGAVIATNYVNTVLRTVNAGSGFSSPAYGSLSAQADGSVLEFYANGGTRENHIAQIAPAGAWRVWAEPETGGEAYIPLAESKRARSLDIWAEVGRRFGVLQHFADGALATTTPTTTPTGPARLHADDLTALADQLAAAVQAGSAAGTRAGFDDWQSSVALMERMRG